MSRVLLPLSYAAMLIYYYILFNLKDQGKNFLLIHPQFSTPRKNTQFRVKKIKSEINLGIQQSIFNYLYQRVYFLLVVCPKIFH